MFQNNPGKTAEFVNIKETPYYKQTDKKVRAQVTDAATKLQTKDKKK